MSPATCAFILAFFGDVVSCHRRFTRNCNATTYLKHETSKHTYIFLLRGSCAPGPDKKVNIVRGLGGLNACQKGLI